MLKRKALGIQGFAVSGILYPILILTIFLIVQILTMMASRKIVLDKNKQQLLDSVNAVNRIYNNEELSILLEEQKTEIQNLKTELNDTKAMSEMVKVYDPNNGYCWKYANGMMICRNKFSRVFPTPTAWGTLYYFKLTDVWTYPVPFASDLMFAHCNVAESSYTFNTGNIVSDRTSITVAEFSRANNSGANGTFKVSCMAVGLWK